MASRKKRARDSERKQPGASSVRRVLRGDGSEESKQRPAVVSDLFGEGDTGNLLRGRFNTDAIYGWFQNRHKRSRQLVDDEGYLRTEDGEHEWKVPYGVRVALHAPLIHAQMACKYPWYATWVSPKTGKRLKKYFMGLGAAITFVGTKAQYADPNASVVSRHGYHIPTSLAGKFPRKIKGKTYYWCPCCMTARVFHRTEPQQDFFAQKKVWKVNDKGIGKYEYVDRHLAVLECGVCGITNRDAKFRRSNQPYEKRRIKQGVRRVKRRRKRRV